MSETSEDRESVLAILRQAGLQPSEEEITAMVATYPLLRKAAESLYQVEGARYEDVAFAVDPRRGWV